nr:uncharacterized protein LOC112040008 [Quercus suber]
MNEEAKCEGLEKVTINADKEKFFQVGVQLSLQEKEELLAFLQENMDVFAWSAYEALEVDPNFICHHLNVNPNVFLKKQPHWRSSREHAKAVKEEVTKLKSAGAIKEVFYSEWLANTMSKVVAEHLRDLRDIFKVLRKLKLQLNVSKCSFSVSSAKFWGYMVTHRGIEVNPDQIKAINDLQPPWNPKEVQKLTLMTTALNRFISQSADRCKPFFQLLHKWKGFEWNEECVLAFQQLKDYLS